MDTIFAYTPQFTPWPPYVNVSIEGGDFVITVRSDPAVHDAHMREGVTGRMKLPRAQAAKLMWALMRSLIHVG